MIARSGRRSIPVFVVLPPRTLLLDVAGPIEVLRRANMVQQAVRFDVRYVGPRAALTTSIGLTVSGIEPLPTSLPEDAMLVLSGSVEKILGIDGTRAAEDEAGDAEIVSWLRAVVQPAHTLVSICSGALLAARAGLLDGYACTTHHDCVSELAAIARGARVLDNRLYVEDRNRLTSAGVTAGVDLMLHIVSRLADHASALSVARYLVVYLRRSGADPQLSPWLEGRNHLHPVVHRVQDAMTADPTRRWTLRSLARLAGTSPRHLTRLFGEHAGMGVAEYRSRVRVALASELLSQTRLDLEHVAERAGFGSSRQLRRAWRKLHPMPPRDVRRAASPPSPTRV